MHEYYEDILSKIKERPQWFDEHAVPRFCKFSPRRLADIYADECALVLIACQSCGHQFKVAFSRDKMDDVKYMMIYGKDKKPPTIAKRIESKSLYYADPPNIECCPAGPTMTSDSIKVLQYWERENLDWKRNRKLEVALEIK